MPIWIIAAIGSVAITAVLTFALWRMNQPMLERNKRESEGGSDGGGPIMLGDGGGRDADHGTSDGGSDGGGDGGGGGGE